jgi:outer membrane protein TolC
MPAAAANGNAIKIGATRDSAIVKEAESSESAAPAEAIQSGETVSDAEAYAKEGTSLLDEWLAGALPLSLEDALALTLAHNRMILASKHDEDAAKAKLDYAESFGLPSLDLSAGYTYSNNPVSTFAFRLNQGRFAESDFAVEKLNDPDFLGNLGVKLAVKYPLYTGGRIDLGKAAAKDNIAASEAATGETARGMAGELIRAYLGGALLEESVRVYDDSVALAEGHVKLAESFYNHGVIVKSDLLAARVFLARMKDERRRFLGALEKVQTGLGVLMDRDLAARYDLSLNLNDVPFVDRDAEHYEQVALSKRPDMAKYLAQREALAKMAEIEARSKFPEVGFYGEMQYGDSGLFMDGSEDATLGIYAQWNLFDGGGRDSRRDELLAQLKSVDEKIEMLKLGIRSEVRAALTDFDVALGNLESAKTIVEQAEENLRIVTNRFREGAATNLEVEDAETSLRQGKLARAAAYHDMHLAFFSLKVATGEIVEDISAG